VGGACETLLENVGLEEGIEPGPMRSPNAANVLYRLDLNTSFSKGFIKLSANCHNTAVSTKSCMWFDQVARIAIAFFLALAFTTSSHLTSPLGVSVALADDDDDGGGGDGGRVDRSDRTDSRTKRPSARVPPKKRQTAANLPVRVRFEIVATGLDEPGLLRLTQRGYRVVQEDAVNFGGGGIIRRLWVPAKITIEQARAEVASQSSEVTADFNHYYRPQEESACEGRVCENLSMVNWQSAEAAKCGRAATIGIVDTAIDTSHSSLKNSNIEVITLRASERRKSSMQHGTAVASLFVGLPQSRVPGLLPGAKVIAVDPYYLGEGSDNRVDVYDLVRSIDLLVQRRPDAINLSLAGPDNSLLAMAVNEALLTNVAVIAAAGNDGPKSKPAYPAAYENVIAVTALDRNYAVYRRAVQGEHIDFSAPGVNVLAAAPNQRVQKRSGTSYAAPFVTAAVARMKANAPNISQAEIVRRLSENVRDLGSLGHDRVFGWGLIQAGGLCKT
jgi:subtilisin family serine protease